MKKKNSVTVEDLRRKSFKSLLKSLREELCLIHGCSIGIGNGYIMEHSSKAIEHFFQLNQLAKSIFTHKKEQPK